MTSIRQGSSAHRVLREDSGTGSSRSGSSHGELFRLISHLLCFTLLLQVSGAPLLASMPRPETEISVLGAEGEWVVQEPLRVRVVKGLVRAGRELGGAVGDLVADVRLARADLQTDDRTAIEPPPEKTGQESREPLRVPLLTDQPAEETPPGELPGTVPEAAGARRIFPTELPPMPPGLTVRALPADLAAIPRALATLDSVPLLPTFNLISLPKEPPDPDPAVVLDPIAGELSRVFVFDACDAADPWKVFDPADPAISDLTVLDHTKGFWIDALTSTTLPVSGTQPPRTEIQLCAGWNLVGYPLGAARPPTSALGSIADRLVRVYGFDPTDPTDPWEVFDSAVPAWVNDLERMHPGRGYWVLVTEDVLLEYANEGAPPVVDITSPADLSEVTTITDVLGTVQSDLLESWTLSVRPAGEEGAFTDLASNTVPVDNALLATLDPTVRLNGLYELRLQATDFAGQIVEDSITVAVDGQQKIGNFTLTFTDLSIPLSGLDLEILRTYDSRDQRKGDFGIGWTLDLRQGSYTNNRTPGEGWQIASGFLPCQAVQETLSHLTSIRLSDREIYRFALRLSSPAATIGGCFARARFDFVDGPVPGATLQILGNTDVLYQNGTNEVLDVDTFEIYEPQAVRLTTPDGRIFDVDLGQGVTRLADLNGNELQITPAGVIHSSGKSVTFERDPEGRIIRITDPRGNAIAYSYDAAGDLTAVTDREAATTRFTYDASHGLLNIDDPRGIQPIRNDYDDSGRLIRHTDAFGKTIELDHDLAAKTEVITDRLGNSRVLQYDERGNIIREVDEGGNETLRTFDGEDNLLSERDPLGNTTSFEYDTAGNQVAVTDPLGNKVETTFNSRGQVLTITDAKGAVTRSTYDAQGNLLSTTDAGGGTTSFTYDSRGNVLTESDAEGAVTTFEYDGVGNLTRQVDALGNATTFTYDANGNRLTETTARTLEDGSTETLTTTFTYDALGRLVSTTDPLGATISSTFDALGNVIETTDPLGRETTFVYDKMGRLMETTHPDGTKESQAYDAEGRVVQQTDRAGRTTRFDYDTVGRLTTTILPDDARTSNTYDASGRLASHTDERGTITRFEYDAMGRRTKVIDVLGQATVFAYDENGNQTSMTDPRGNVMRFEYDALNRLVRTVFPDGTDRTITYDALGRRTAETDQAGNSTGFAYDALGRLTTVTDALGQVTSTAYDEVGNRVAQTDAKGHTTRFAYDAVGREIRRTLPPVGSDPASSETRVYDLAGNLVQHTNFNGQTRIFEYDTQNRLTARRLPDGSSFTFTYTATGRRATVTDARGTTTYSYDERDRLTALGYPDGRSLLYDYDAAGNRIALTARIGTDNLSTTYSYDVLNRLDVVTDPDGRTYDHGYDANGNRASLAYPNGVTTAYTYDALNRLTDLTSRDSGGGVIQSYAYDLGPAGNRRSATEADGTTRTYTYDALFRLTAERVTDGAAVQVFDDQFTYDPVGNRVEQVTMTADGTVTAPSTFDARDRLLTDSAATFTWDDAGRLLSRTGLDDATYAWNADERLVRVETADGTVVTHAYDADGNRVRTEITPSTGPPVVTDFLVDPSGDLSQVVAETDADGNLTAHYVRGDDLLAVMRPAETRFFHADGLGSIRRLTDETGTVTDRYSFKAFGELLDHDGADPNAYLFAGEALDPNSGFYYLRARWMAPEVGRFVSTDPFPGLIFEPISLHKYHYAGINPVNRVDPSGLISVGEAAVVGAMIGLLVTQLLIQTSGLRLTLFETTLLLFAGAALGAALGALAAGAALGVGTAGATGAAGAAASAAPRFAQFDWSRAGHIFRAARGHVNPLFHTTKLRFARLFEVVASNPQNLRSSSSLPAAARDAGVQVFTQNFARGQVWVHVRSGQIINAGVNRPGSFR